MISLPGGVANAKPRHDTRSGNKWFACSKNQMVRLQPTGAKVTSTQRHSRLFPTIIEIGQIGPNFWPTRRLKTRCLASKKKNTASIDPRAEKCAGSAQSFAAAPGGAVTACRGRRTQRVDPGHPAPSPPRRGEPGPCAAAAAAVPNDSAAPRTKGLSSPCR